MVIRESFGHFCPWSKESVESTSSEASVKTPQNVEFNLVELGKEKKRRLSHLLHIQVVIFRPETDLCCVR